jgi:type I restriction enzyme R subunit
MYGEKDNANKIKSEIEEMVSSLPKDNISVKENRRKLNHVFEDNFWDNVAEDPIDYVENQVAPLLKYQSQVDVDEMAFQVKTEKLGLAILQQNDKTIKNIQKSIANDVNNLSNNLNAVKEIIDDKNKVLSHKFWEDIKYEDAEFLEKTFKPIIKLKTKRSREIIELDLDDIIAEQKLIQKTTLGNSEFVKEYKIKIENSIKKLANDNPIIAKIMKGEEPNDEELMDLEHALFSLNEAFETESLRKIFNQPTGSFGQFIKHILGLYEFPNFEQECADAFDIFIKEHENWNADQILFVRTVKNTISKKGKMDISDLFEAPFDRIGTLSKLFEENDVEDLMLICKTLEKRNNA